MVLIFIFHLFILFYCRWE